MQHLQQVTPVTTSNISKTFSFESIMIPVPILMDFQFEHPPGKLEITTVCTV